MHESNNDTYEERATIAGKKIIDAMVDGSANELLALVDDGVKAAVEAEYKGDPDLVINIYGDLTQRYPDELSILVDRVQKQTHDEDAQWEMISKVVLAFRLLESQSLADFMDQQFSV